MSDVKQIYQAIPAILADVEWVPALGHDEYAATADGRICSLNYGGTGEARFLKPIPASNGYLHVTLVSRGETKQYLLHRLIAASFHGYQIGQTVNHKSGEKTDNRPANLEWVSQSENVKHAYRTGLRTINAAHRERCGTLGKAKRKLTPEQAASIRTEFAAGGTSKTALSRRFGIDRKSIAQIINGQTYTE